MKYINKFIVVIALLIAILTLFIYPYQLQKGVSEGLQLCGGVIIPSLLPFMALANFISRTDLIGILAAPLKPLMAPLFRLPKNASGTVLLSFIGGYPVGASSVAMLCARGDVNRKEAERMLTFCANSGPAMAIIAIGKGLLGNIYVGWIIYLSHIAAAILTGWCFSRFSPKPLKNKTDLKTKAQSFPDAFVGGVSDAALQMLYVCGYVTIFSGATALFNLWRVDWLTAVTEVTCGTKWAALSGLSAPLICSILSFGGFSVMCQISALSHSLISFKKLLLSRITNSVFAFFICSLAIRALPQSLQVISNLGENSLWFSESSVLLSISMLFMAAVFLCSVSSKEKVLQK